MSGNPNRRDRIHLDFTFFHPVAVADFDVGAGGVDGSQREAGLIPGPAGIVYGTTYVAVSDFVSSLNTEQELICRDHCREESPGHTLCLHAHAQAKYLPRTPILHFTSPWPPSCTVTFSMRQPPKQLLSLSICMLPIALAAQSTYSAKNYGIALQFPSIYEVEEGELDANALGYLGPIPMDFAAPGGVRVVTVQLPPDLYPGTDFDTAFVTFSVNQYLTRDECEQPPDGTSEPLKPITRKIAGMKFHPFDVGYVGPGHQFGGTYYHAFSHGACYEIGEGLATSGYGALEGMQRVDGGQVFASLGRILQSVTISAPKIGKKNATSPSIRSFWLMPLLQHAPTGTYRVSWDVRNAEANRIWLSASCPSNDVSISELAPSAAEDKIFPAETVQPAAAASGSLDLEFRNLTGGDIKANVRLFAAGTPPVSKSITIDLPPLPVVISMTGWGNVFSFARTPVRVVAGQAVSSHCRSNCGHRPDACGSRQPSHHLALEDDGSSPEESNPGDNLSGNSGRIQRDVLSTQDIMEAKCRNEHECGSTQTHHGVCAQTCGALRTLALHAHDSAQNGSRADAQNDLQNCNHVLLQLYTWYPRAVRRIRNCVAERASGAARARRLR